MASCGAPPSSLIIMNLLATSVFTNYNTVSLIKDLDMTPSKIKSSNIDYIDDAFSVNNNPTIGDKYEEDPVEKLGTNEIDIKTNKEHMVEYINDGFTQLRDLVELMEQVSIFHHRALHMRKEHYPHL